MTIGLLYKFLLKWDGAIIHKIDAQFKKPQVLPTLLR